MASKVKQVIDDPLRFSLLVVKNKNQPSSSSTSSRISTMAMQQIVERLKNVKHRKGTSKNYLSVWRSFNNFIIRLDQRPAQWEDRIVLFVGYLIQNNRKSTTINSYISAIKSVLADDGVILNEDRYLLNALTKACKMTNDRVRTRLPIQKGLLNMILRHTALIYDQQPYLKTLYMSLFATGYYGLFRVGELTTGTHPIKAVDVHVAMNKNKLMFVLRSSKTHDESMKPQTVKITAEGESTNTACCPFRLLQSYLRVRRSCRQKNEPFFIFRDRTPVTPVHARRVLKEALIRARIDSNFYDFHSFRAGRALDLRKMNFSVESIKFLGRWQSNAVFTYLKLN